MSVSLGFDVGREARLFNYLLTSPDRPDFVFTRFDIIVAIRIKVREAVPKFLVRHHISHLCVSQLGLLQIGLFQLV